MQFTAKHDTRLARFKEAGLYVVTSEPLSAGRTTLEIVEQALAGGVKLIQLREKTFTDADLLALAQKVRTRTAEANALLIINDRLDIAQQVDADGVHVGQEDMPVAEARELAPDMILGVSTHSVEEARQAEADGASYINIGPLFPTETKKWDEAYLGLEGLREISAAITIPFTVMGGIKKEHIPDLIENSARIIALVTAVTQAEDPAAAASALLQLIT